jgi:ketosteroid isomerase-like protein
MTRLRIVSALDRLHGLPGCSALTLALACALSAPHVVCRAAPTEVPGAATDDVVAADREFAQLALESGIRAAYDRYLESDAVVFRPLPVPAREWFATHEPATGRLEWVPATALTACDASLAVTLGTWSYTAQESKQPDTGHYLTAWRRSDEGGWRIVLDQSLSFAALPAIAERTPGPCDGSTSEQEKLFAADRKLNGGLRSLPANTAPTIAVRAVTVGAVMGSTRADLALTHGELVDRKAARGTQPQVRAVYVRVWEREGRAWRVVQDFTTAVTQ